MKKSTYSAKADEAQRKWLLVDLKGKILGRAATEIANILRGKHKATFTPHVDTGDFVVAINAAQIKLTGNKLLDKKYYNHSTYIGGMKIKSAEQIMERKPEDLIRRAVKGMIPHNNLGHQVIKKLKIFSGAEHTHAAQTPVNYELKN
ncbi:MAG: 50S ribosomal protein L13 [Deltaproteobacteria bacterium]|nr:50S ribosomal protein L13 [Deltaproteobacteria bacterium]